MSRLINCKHVSLLFYNAENCVPITLAARYDDTHQLEYSFICFNIWNNGNVRPPALLKFKFLDEKLTITRQIGALLRTL